MRLFVCLLRRAHRTNTTITQQLPLSSLNSLASYLLPKLIERYSNTNSSNPNHPADMAPTRSKKRKSAESTNSIDVQNFPVPPQIVPTKTRSPLRTPTTRSPIKKPAMGITLGQKQALIDNLQLESKYIAAPCNP
jgi:hypothetical protein